MASILMFTCPHCGCKTNNPELTKMVSGVVFADCPLCGRNIEKLSVNEVNTIIEGRKDG